MKGKKFQIAGIYLTSSNVFMEGERPPCTLKIRFSMSADKLYKASKTNAYVTKNSKIRKRMQTAESINNKFIKFMVCKVHIMARRRRREVYTSLYM